MFVCLFVSFFPPRTKILVCINTPTNGTARQNLGESELRCEFKHQPASPGARRARCPVLAEGPRGQNRRGVCGDCAESRYVLAESGGQEPNEGRSMDGGRQYRFNRLSKESEPQRVPGLSIPVRPDRPPPSTPSIHPSSPHSSSPLHPSLQFLIATSIARSPSLDPGPPPSQLTTLATIRPTCRRGHFSTGPRLQLFKEEMSFRFSLSRVPALLSFP